MALDLWNLIFNAAAFTCVSFIAFCTVVYSTSSKFPKLFRFDAEKCYVDPKESSKKKLMFPSIDDKPSVYLSVIIPAYNEQKRLPPMLDECLEYLEKRKKKDSAFTYEIIIVDDGSTDQTSKTSLKYVEQYGVDKVRLLTLVQNRGKGGAVRMGMLSSRGMYRLFADADGATKFSDFEKLESSIKSENSEGEKLISVGSRAHLEQESISKRSAFRTFLMYGFHFLVWLLAVRRIRDTQCGFKLFSYEAARCLFPALHVERWAFDVELLYIAEKLNIPITEVAVNWTEIEGSKLIPVWSWVQMGKDLFFIWFKYQIGAWKILKEKKS